MDIQFFSGKKPTGRVLIVPVLANEALGKAGAALDKELKGALTSAMDASDTFEGKKDQILLVNGFSHKTIKQVVLYGFGKIDGLLEKDFINSGGALWAYLNMLCVRAVTVLSNDVVTKDKQLDAAATIAYGMVLRSYRFEKYKTTLKPENKSKLKKVSFAVTSEATTRKVWKDKAALIKGIFLARDLVTEPPNKLYPASFVKMVQKSVKGLPIKIKTLNKTQMEKLGMGALLAVNAGSLHPAFTLIMEYNGLGKNIKTPPIVLAGKGVTFDSGGYCIKPGMGTWPMADMKFDMAGGAAVAGALESLARRKAKVRAIGIIGLVENRIDDKAMLPSYVVKTMSGQTMEIMNTDAEGRMVLADILWYAQQQYKPKTVINLATLTGAIVMALADQYAGVFANDDKLAKDLYKAGLETGEKVWQMPLDGALDRHIDSPIADMSNMGNGGAGASVAAKIISRFIKPGVNWAHIDMAGMAWSKAPNAQYPAGATGYGVRLLDQYIRNVIEK